MPSKAQSAATGVDQVRPLPEPTMGRADMAIPARLERLPMTGYQRGIFLIIALRCR
jgi:hypothetical protein